MLYPKNMRVLWFVQPLCNKMTFDVINGIIYCLNGINLCFLNKKNTAKAVFSKINQFNFLSKILNYIPKYMQSLKALQHSSNHQSNDVINGSN